MFQQVWTGRILMAAGLAAMLAAPAAATPTVTMDGATYMFTGTIVCQAGDRWPSGIYLAYSGTGAFGATTVSLNEQIVRGPFNTRNGSFNLTSSKFSYPWSNTATTLTINGIVYETFYNNINGSNQPGTLTGVAVDGNGCARNFTGQIMPPLT